MFSCVLHTRKMILRNVDLLGKGHTSNKQLRGKSLAPICLQSLGPLHIPNGKGYLGSKPWIASHSKIIKQGITHNFIPCIRTLLLLMPVRCNKCLCDQEEVIKERGRISGRRKRKHSHRDPKATWCDYTWVSGFRSLGCTCNCHRPKTLHLTQFINLIIHVKGLNKDFQNPSKVI